MLGLHAYEAAARHGSFVAAAAELHLSPAAVSQRVRNLEAHLGVQLFERLPRSVQLTEMGRAYLPAVRDIFDDLSAATSGLFGGPRPREVDGAGPGLLRRHLAGTSPARLLARPTPGSTCGW